MKLTIAFDDISLPLPPMRRPDIRQRVIEAVLDLAAAAGVDDVHLIAALALHRRMTEAELRHAVGDRVYDAFAPHGLALQPRRRGPRRHGLPRHDRRRARRSRSTSGPPRATCSSTSTSTSSSMDGGWKSTATGLAGYRSLRHHHNVAHDAAQPQSFMDRHKSRAALRRTGAWARCSSDAGVKIFQIETTLNNDTFGTSGRCRCCRSASGSGRRSDRATFIGASKAGSTARRPARPQDLPRRGEAPHGMTSVQAGEVEAVHEVTTAERATSSSSCRSRARPTSSRWGCPTSAPTT